PVLSLGFLPQQPQILLTINQVVKDSPANHAGLKKGDKLTAINGQALTSWQQFTAIIKRSANKTLSLQIEREEQYLTITLVPGERANLSGEQEGFAGIVPLTDVMIQRYNIPEAALKAVLETKKMVVMSLRSFWLLASGVLDLKHLSG